MGKYTDDEIRAIKKITCKIAADYLGIAPMAVSIGMQQEKLPNSRHSCQCIDSHVPFFTQLKNALCYSFFCIQFASHPCDIS